MHFRDLSEAQILALAITAEEEDSRIYRDFAESLRAHFPASTELFTRMAAEEDGHRHRLTELYRQKFGEHIPLIRRQDVQGFIKRRPSWVNRTLRPELARGEAALMEIEARHFYEQAAQRTTDAGIRQLLNDLAQEEQKHEAAAETISREQSADGTLHEEGEAARRLFVLRFVQPGLAGLMDGSVSTLAPLFAAENLPRWVKRGELASRRVTIADDASADAPCDGEGTATRRILVVEAGALASRLYDLRSAARASVHSTGHGVRPSYRTPPRPGPRRLFFETAGGVAPPELLAGVGKGVFARALTAPITMDLEGDRYSVEFTGVAILGGRASEPVAGARVSGRISELLARIAGVATDRQFFPMPYPVGAPTLLVERASFE